MGRISGPDLPAGCRDACQAYDSFCGKWPDRVFRSVRQCGKSNHCKYGNYGQRESGQRGCDAAYDSNVLEFVSGTNAEGGAGAIRVHGDGGTPNTTKLRFTLTFNALAAGTTKITVTSQEVYDSNSQLVTIERQGDSTVTVGALSTASNDATLRSLQVSPGTLTPAFSPDVDTYAVTVGTDVDKLIVSAECANENATNVVSGNENLQMGENRVTCQVTAQDGETVKEYVIVVTKAEGGASADTSQAAGFPMRVSERTITVLEPDASVEIRRASWSARSGWMEMK